MGIKFLSLHMIPWCLHMMGNISCIHQLPHESSLQTVKIIKSDGHVKIYDRPVNASELMRQFPKHLICNSDSFFIGQKIPALSETDELKLGHNYFLLPKHFFQSVLSFVTIASFAASNASTSSKNAFIRTATFCHPFDIHKTASGTVQIRVSDEFILKLMEEERVKEEKEKVREAKGRVCTTPELQKDYTQLVGFRRSKDWKPTLETISEKERKKLGDFGMKGRKKSQSRGTQKNQRLEQHQATSPPKSKEKKRS